MKPTAEQLKDPKWWDENAPKGATHYKKENDGLENEGWYNFNKTPAEFMFFYSRDSKWLATLSEKNDVESIITERPASNIESSDTVNLSKYHREIKPGVWVDVYDVIKAWSITNPAQQHLAKKALQAGDRGHKSYAEDMSDIIASANRAVELDE